MLGTQGATCSALSLQRAGSYRSDVLAIVCSARSRVVDIVLPRESMAKRFEDLLCWQLSREVKCEVLAFTAIPAAVNDRRFCDQIRDSSAGAPRNIAEGFGRYRPGDFARFLEYARASLMETQNHLIDARDRRYISEATYARLFNLSQAALRTTTRLMRSKQKEARATRTQARAARNRPAH